MFDLIWSYLLIIILILGANISLFLGDSKSSKFKFISTSILLSIVIFVISYVSGIFKNNLIFLNDQLGWLFIAVAIVLFIMQYLYLRNKKLSWIISLCLLFIMVFALSSQIEATLFDSLLWALFLFIILIAVYPISVLLHYAKREFPVIVGEYISIEAILILIIGATYWSVKTLDYSMFSPFLILTPTYQLVYVIIGIIVVMILGLYHNDRKLKR